MRKSIIFCQETAYLSKKLFSNNLLIVGRIEKGLKLFGLTKFPYLWRGITIALSKHSGNPRVLMKSLNSTVTTVTSENFFRI